MLHTADRGWSDRWTEVSGVDVINSGRPMDRDVFTGAFREALAAAVRQTVD